MKNITRQLEAIIIEHKPTACSNCGNKIYYLDGGQYQCRTCGNIMLDDFGKIKKFIEENGPSPSPVITANTGVHPDIIDRFLRKGRVEIPEGSKYYIKCERCGCSLRFGRYCEQCVKETVQDLKHFNHEDEGLRPKIEYNPNNNARIHFFHQRNK